MNGLNNQKQNTHDDSKNKQIGRKTDLQVKL